MKRTALTRKTQLRRTSKLESRKPIERKAKLRKVNPERVKDHRRSDFDGEIGHRDYVCRQDCCVCVALKRPQKSPTQPAHVEARGMGAARGKWFDIANLCGEDQDKLDGRVKCPSDEREFIRRVAADAAARACVQNLANRVKLAIIIPDQESGRIQ